MDTHQFAFAIHGLGLSYPELLGLHHALDTPDHCIQRVKTELLSQGFEVGFSCTHPQCARTKLCSWNHVVMSEGFLPAKFFVKHQAQHVDCFEFVGLDLFYHFISLHHEMPMMPEYAHLAWEQREFIVNASRRVGCKKPKQLIQALKWTVDNLLMRPTV